MSIFVRYKKDIKISGLLKNGKDGLVLGCGVWREFEGEKGERTKKLIDLQAFPPNPSFLVLFLPSVIIRL